MKRLFNLPTNNEVLNHEGPEAARTKSFIRWGMLVSAITVCFAWNFYLDDWLKNLGWFRWVVVLVIFAALAYPVERTIQGKSSYLWSLFLRKKIGKAKFSFWLNAPMLLILVIYSTVFSLVSTRQTMTLASNDERKREIDISQFEDDYQASIELYRNEAAQSATEVRQNYAQQVEAIRDQAEAEKSAIDTRIAYYRERESRGRGPYPTKISDLEAQKASVETESASRIQTLRNAERNEIARIESNRESLAMAAAERRDDAIVDAKGRNTSNRAMIGRFSATFGWIVSILAAGSVWFVVLLTGHLEMFYIRAGIEPTVKADNSFFFDTGLLGDLLALPGAVLEGFLGEWVRKVYARIPNATPRFDEQLYNMASAQQQVVNLAPKSKPIAPVEAPLAGAVARQIGFQVGGRADMGTRPEEPPVKPEAEVEVPVAPAPESKTEVSGAKIIDSPPITDGSIQPRPVESKGEPFSLKELASDSGSGALVQPMEFEWQSIKPVKEYTPGEQTYDDLIDLIKKAFKDPPAKSNQFYDVIGQHPSKFQTDADYIHRLKKELRNRWTGAIKEPTARNRATVQRNRLRYLATKYELQRMYVDVVEREGGSPSVVGYLKPNHRNELVLNNLEPFIESLPGWLKTISL